MLVLRRFSALGSFAAVAIAAGLLTTDPRPAAGQTVEFEVGKTLYENPLSGPEDIEGWILESSEEGHPAITFPHGRMRMESDVHFLLWHPDDFPDRIAVSWDFQPRIDTGLAMFWIAATGEDGKDLFDPSLAPREGHYHEYRRGDINALHVAYFRRNPHEIGFQICSLRKTTVHDDGPIMQRRPDPLPSARDATRPYRMQAIKYGPYFRLTIDDMVVIDWKDDGAPDSVLAGGKIGFRQMAGLIADYGNLTVQEVVIKKSESYSAR